MTSTPKVNLLINGLTVEEFESIMKHWKRIRSGKKRTICTTASIPASLPLETKDGKIIGHVEFLGIKVCMEVIY